MPEKYSHLIPSEEKENIIAACWTHDVIEDCRQTYNDVKDALNEDVADMVFALTTEKGKNRKERANAKYYYGIRQTQFATFIKLCDRLANISHSVASNSEMARMYRKEHEVFKSELYHIKYKTMFDEMEELLQIHQTY